MSTNSLIAYRTAETKGVFEIGSYVHWDGYPTHMGQSWWKIAHHEMFGGNLASLVEYFIIGNPFGWSVIDWRRDITKKPISTERNSQEYGYLSPGEPVYPNNRDDLAAMDAYFAACDAHEATKPLVSFRARRWDIMEKFGHTSEAEAEKDPRCTGDWRWESMDHITPETLHHTCCEYVYVIDIDARTMTVYAVSEPLICGGVFNLDGPEPDWGALFPEED